MWEAQSIDREEQFWQEQRTSRNRHGWLTAICANHRFQCHERSQLFVRTHNETLSVAAMRVSNPDRSSVGVISGVRPVSTPLAQSSRVYLAVSRRISRSTSVERNFKKMKTFIVYDLDSQMPVAVGEQVSAETARYCASVVTGIFQANLLAEEIDLEKQITY